jgi:hypothetical protein
LRRQGLLNWRHRDQAAERSAFGNTFQLAPSSQGFVSFSPGFNRVTEGFLVFQPFQRFLIFCGKRKTVETVTRKYHSTNHPVETG